MKKRSCLLAASLAAVFLLAVFPRPAAAYIDILPPTLGNLCHQATHIHVLRVEKVSTEKGVILFKSVEQLKEKGELPLPDGALTKQVIGPNVLGAKVILDGAAEGKTAVLFVKTFGVKAAAHVYVNGYWCLLSWNINGKYWAAVNGEPTMLVRYCGTADKLGDAVAKILSGEEVVVPGMANDDRKALEEGRGKVQQLRASLKILGNPKQNLDGDKKPDDKKPGAKKPAPGEKKPGVRTPERVGTVKALAADGKSFTLQPAPTEKNKEPAPIEIQIREDAKIMAGKEPGKLTVGQTVNLWLAKGSKNIAVQIQIGKLPEPPEKKPAPPDKGKKPTPGAPEKKPGEKKPGDKKPDDKKPDDKKPGDKKPDDKKPGDKGKKPDDKKPAEKGGKPAPDANDKKPDEPKKPKEPAKPARDPAPTAAIIDAEVDRHLATIKVPGSPQADDAEFLRRVTLDLTGRIPTYQQTVAFLDSKDPDKRRQLIDELLDSPAYGEHLATIWRNLLVGRGSVVNVKQGNSDGLRPWLAEQFNNNRGWNGIVTDLLTAEGTPRDNPATAFLLANGENSRPQPNKVAGAAAALFWGVNLRCAECHKHPFAHWKQNDFWGTAAFFGKVQFGGSKGGPQSLMESLSGGTSPTKKKGQTAPVLRGTAIVIPAESGKLAGQVVKARFLGGDEPALDEQEPFRPRFAAWATAADNPYFARAAVNRLWAHFFGRGFVNPLDAFDESNPPSHPELLERLAKEFASSGFDLKHLARCITTSKAYQRTSRPVPGNEANTVAFSHMAVKVLTPEVLFDALAIIGKGNGGNGQGNGASGKGNGKGSGEKQDSRDQFLRFFRFDDEAAATEYIQGIPQLLRLMNTSSLNRGVSVVDKLCSSGASRPEAIATLYLTVLSRRPMSAEIELMSSYLSRRKDDREGYRGVLWMLLNSSEFALNR